MIGAAQAPITSTTLRFGIAYGAGTPTGEIDGVIAAPSGFVTWAALPISRRSPIGIRGEFSILTIPEERASGMLLQDVDLDLTIRSTIGFTGVGPRLETRAGPIVIAGAVMGGVTRSIVDANGRLTGPVQMTSVALSQSEQAMTIKGALDVYLPIHFGRQDAAIGLTAGLDWLRSGRLTVLRSGTFRLSDDGELSQESIEAPITMWGWRVGLGLFF